MAERRGTRGGARRRPQAAGDGGPRPGESVSEALTRARRHGRMAAAELLAALRALLDAASLAAVREDAQSNRALQRVAQLLDDFGAGLADASDASAPLLEAIADALDAEIERWQARANDDPEARAVLRAFLGVRELLWEFGVRRSAPRNGSGSGRTSTRSRRGGAKRRRPPRVQRVNIEG